MGKESKESGAVTPEESGAVTPEESGAVTPEESGAVTPEAQIVAVVDTDETPSNIVPDGDTTPSAIQAVSALDSLVAGPAESMAGFDPTIHAVGADGQPIRRADGTLAKKRGRKPGQKGGRFSSGTLPSPENLMQSTGALPEQENPTNEQSAKMCTNLTISAGVMFFGANLGKPEKGEPEMLKKAYKDYFDMRGAVNLPPEIALLFAIGAYALPRLQHESMAEKVSRYWGAVTGFFRKPKKDTEKGKAGNAPENNAPDNPPPNPPRSGNALWAMGK